MATPSTRCSRPISRAAWRPRLTGISISRIARGIRCRRKAKRPSATRCRRETYRGPGTAAAGTPRPPAGGGGTAALAEGRRDAKEKRAVIYSRGPGALAFQPHHQPFNYFERYAPGTAERATHLKDGDDFLADIGKGTLPQVAFYKPVGRN